MNIRSDKNLIMIPYADIQGAQTGVNIVNIDDRKTIYIKNCCVALISAKHYNPDCDVALVTNVQVPENYANLLNEYGVQIILAPFDSFRFDFQYTWSLAFYKLCALKTAVAEYPHKAYCYLDTDVYVQSSFSCIWKECSEYILMYDINHGLQVKDYRNILKEFEMFSGSSQLLTHYGGEFFAAEHDNAEIFLRECSRIYEEMQKKNFVTKHGDEFITSLAAHNLRSLVKNAGSYIFRFWTGGFYLVSSCYQYNPVVVLHVPAEKEHGMLTIFSKFISKGVIPKNEIVWRCLHMKRRAARVTIALLVRKILRAVRKK